jgi:hypothetical protein
MLQITSFLLGVGTALALPGLGRVIRPVIVEAAVAGTTLFEEARRILAEQMEHMEDIAAEVRTRREAAAMNGRHHDEPEPSSEDEEAHAPRARRRTEAASRRRTS